MDSIEAGGVAGWTRKRLGSSKSPREGMSRGRGGAVRAVAGGRMEERYHLSRYLSLERNVYGGWPLHSLLSCLRGWGLACSGSDIKGKGKPMEGREDQGGRLSV